MQALTSERLFFNVGVVGVSFFFVLSGFIQTYNYADIFRPGVSAGDYKRFVWDRWAKIYPVHIAALLLEAPMSIFSPNRPFLWSALPFHLTLLQCFWPSATPPFYDYLNIPSWSVSCEWFFYLLAPVTMSIVFRNARGRLGIACAVLAYASALGWLLWSGASDVTRLYMVSWFAPSRFVEFLTGIFLARAFLGGWFKNASRLSASMAEVSGVALIVAGAVLRHAAPWPMWGGLLYVPGSAVLVLSLSLGRGILARHLSLPPLRALGMASFSFYLIHGPMLRIAKNICERVVGWQAQSWIDFWAVTFITFVLIQISAFLLYACYEVPVQKRLRNWLRVATSHPETVTTLRQSSAKV